MEGNVLLLSWAIFFTAGFVLGQLLPLPRWR